jgi:ABC-2 type transport system ATP-binding protein
VVSTVAAAPALQIDGLTLDRGGRRVLDGLSLTLHHGEVYALLGSNGAGKSTTLAAILGLLRPQAGGVTVAGRPVAADPDGTRRNVAYLPETVALYEHLSAQENVRYFLELAATPRDDAAIAAAFTAVGLERDAWRRRTGTFSKGMRQKTAIALALLRDTRVLLLDEPTSGLDPGATRDFHGLVAALRERGVAVLMVSHDLLGVADLADRIGLLADGRIAAEWAAAPAAPRFDVAGLHRRFLGASAA